MLDGVVSVKGEKFEIVCLWDWLSVLPYLIVVLIGSRHDCVLSLMDLSSHPLRGRYYHVSVCNDIIDLFVFAVYDVTQRDSFASLEMWLTELDTYATKKDLVKMLVGNKIDKASVFMYVCLCISAIFMCLCTLWQDCYDLRYMFTPQHIYICDLISSPTHVCLQSGRDVERQEGMQFARRNSMLFIESRYEYSAFC